MIVLSIIIGGTITNKEKIEILKEQGLFTPKPPRKAKQSKVKVVEQMSSAVADIVNPVVSKTRSVVAVAADIADSLVSKKRSEVSVAADIADSIVSKTSSVVSFTKLPPGKKAKKRKDISSEDSNYESDKEAEKIPRVQPKRSKSQQVEVRVVDSEKSDDESTVQPKIKKIKYKEESCREETSYFDDDGFSSRYDNDAWWDGGIMDTTPTSSSTAVDAINEQLISFEVGEKVRNRFNLSGVITAKHINGSYDIKCK